MGTCFVSFLAAWAWWLARGAAAACSGDRGPNPSTYVAYVDMYCVCRGIMLVNFHLREKVGIPIYDIADGQALYCYTCHSIGLAMINLTFFVIVTMESL